VELSKVEGAGVEREISIIFQVFDCVIPDGEGTYLAAPISTGPRYFSLLEQHRVSDFNGLIDAIGEAEYLRLVRWPNVRDGEETASRLRSAGVRNLINTGPIFIDRWDGKDYMTLCLALIARKVSRVYFHPDWAFSSGAVEEFVFCAQRNIELRTLDDEELTLIEGRSQLARVQQALQSFPEATEILRGQIAVIESLSSHKKAQKAQNRLA